VVKPSERGETIRYDAPGTDPGERGIGEGNDRGTKATGKRSKMSKRQSLHREVQDWDRGAGKDTHPALTYQSRREKLGGGKKSGGRGANEPGGRQNGYYV